MSNVISIHEYILKPGVSERQFESAILGAKKRGLLHLPGLVDYYLVKGIRGSRNGSYAAVWTNRRTHQQGRLSGKLEGLGK